MKLNILRFTLLVCILALLVGCGPAPISEETAPDSDYVVAEADNYYKLTMSQLADLMINSSAFPEGGLIDTADVTGFLDSIVVDTLIGMAADEIRIEDDYDQNRIYKLRYYDAIIEQYFKDVVYDVVEADSLEAVDFYNSRPDLFGEQEKVFIYHILISPRGLKNGPDSAKYEYNTWEEIQLEAERLAREIRTLVDSRESFMEAAQQYSHDTTTGRFGGLMGWAAQGVYVDPFDSVAFSMNAGDISEPYQDYVGWHIIYVHDRQEAGIPPLDRQNYLSAYATLKTVKSNELGRQIVDTLFANISLEYNDSMLDTNLYKVNEQQWVAVVNGQDTIDCNEARGAEYRVRTKERIANTTAEMKKEMLMQVAQRYALVQQGKKLGVDENPDVVAQERFLRHKYSRVIVERPKKDPGWQPADSSVKSYYEEHLQEFKPEKPLVVQHIIVQDSLFGDFVRSQAMSGYDFLDLAKEYYPGDEDVRVALADLGEIGRGDVPEAFYDAALRVMVGEVSHPVKTEYGYHVIKVLDRRETSSLMDAGPRIIEILKKQHAQEVYRAFRDSLFAKYNARLTGKVVPVELPPLSLRN